ncbi:glycosyl transferase [Bacteroidia bacterium]|nr:glycosyl transferase [Bacteroidia bacterium]
MPVYNAQAYLEDSINSILEQSFKSFELIIINDGSTDNSLDLLGNYSDNRVQVINSEHDFIKSLNIGMTQARGQYIARMDADDIMLPYRLTMQYGYMEAHPEVDICGGWLETFGNETATTTMQQSLNQRDILSTMLLHCPLYHPTVMMKRSIIDNMPLIGNIRLCYKEDYIYAEDYKLWSDLAMSGYRFANIPEVLTMYRISKTQNTSRYLIQMQQTTIKIQGEYAEFFMEKMLEDNESYYNILNEMIDLHNKDILNFNQLRRILYILGSGLQDKQV